MSKTQVKSRKIGKQASSTARKPVTPALLWLIAMALMCIVGYIQYAHVVDAPFFFDDDTSIVSNDDIKGDNRLAKIWASDKRRFVPYLTFAWNYSVNGLEESGYRTVNIGVHLAAGCTVFWLVWLLLGSPAMRAHPLLQGGRGKLHVRFWFALFAGLLFISHPVQTQAVTYIVQRMASLAALFSLLSMALYAVFAQRRASGAIGLQGWLAYVGALVSVVLGMYSKENTFIVPLAIMLMDMLLYSSTKDQRIKAAITAIPLLCTLAIIPATLFLSAASAGVQSPVAAEIGSKIPVQHYLLTQFNVIVTYLRLLVLPTGQNLDYDYPIATSLLSGTTLPSLALLLALVGLAVWLWKRQPLASFGILFFFLALSLESSVISLPDVIFEHRLYLPILGFILAAGSGLLYLASLAERKGVSSSVVPLVFSVIVVAMSVASYERNTVWASVESLWGDVIQKSPGKARGYVNLGDYYFKSRSYDRSMGYFRKAVALDSNSIGGNTNLGCVLWMKGQLDESERYIRRALYLQPKAPQPYSILGSIYFNRGNIDSAEVLFRRSIALRSEFVDGHANLGAVFMRRQQFDSAAAQFQFVIERMPNHPQANHNLALSYFNVQRYDDALIYARRAQALGLPVAPQLQEEIVRRAQGQP